MSKIITLEGAKEKQLKGINTVANLMKITIGPKGRNVSLTNGEVVNDGGRIAQDIILKDPIENKGASKLKTLVHKTSEDVGGGRTATAILFQSLVTEGLKLLDKGINVNALKRDMQEAVSDINKQLTALAKPVKSKKEIQQVATISTESEELGEVIADTIEKIGKDGVVTVEESQTFGITTEIVEGLKFDKGYISPYMITNERMEAEYKNVPVLVTNRKIISYKEFFPLIDKVVKSGKNSLVVIAEDIEGEALTNFILNRIKGAFNVLAIKAPGFGENKKMIYEDLSKCVGDELLTEEIGDFNTVKLGSARKVLSKKNETVIIGGGGDLKSWIATLQMQMNMTENKWEKDQYIERIAKLSNGMAVLKVGAGSETEMKYLKLKIEDGVNESKRALEEGIITGGDVAYLNALKAIALKGLKIKDTPGYKLVVEAIEAPLRQIIKNSNGSPDVIIDKIKSNPSLTVGYDSLDNKVVADMYKAGIIDAVKVTKTVLQNAVSEAGIFLTIDGDISEELKEDENL